MHANSAIRIGDAFAYDYDLRGLTRYACFGSSSTTSCDTSGSGETNSFDGFGNLIWRKSRMFGTTCQFSYQYDLEGNRTRITHPDGQYFTYNRDGRNRVCTLGESAAAPACSTTDPAAFLVMHYSPEGRRADITRPGSSVTSYATDNALRLDTFTQNFSGTTNDLTNGFDYNPASQITALTQSNLQYNYTEAQNRVGAYGVNALNRYTSIDGVTVTYDLNGNLTADGAGMTYTYDMENHLVSTGGVSSTLSYDVLGRLARLSVAGTTTDFHYDGDALVGEYVGTPLTRRYVHSGGVDEPLVQYNSASVGTTHRRYLYADHQGSIIAHSDNAGVVTQKNAYDPYGIPKSAVGNGNEGRFGYTGQTWLKELGLNYYKARIYSPKPGRFLQTDPIFYKDDMNLYAYVRSDPINSRDPTGLKCQGTGDQASCTIDEVNIGTSKKEHWVSRADAIKSGKVSEKQLGRLEGNILAVYRSAQQLGKGTTLVKGNAALGVKDTRVSGSRIEMIMQDQNLRASNANYVDEKGVEKPGTPATSQYGEGITFWKPAFHAPLTPAGEYLQRLAASHEPLHFIPQLAGWNNHPREHQVPFNEAVESLIGPPPP